MCYESFDPPPDYNLNRPYKHRRVQSDCGVTPPHYLCDVCYDQIRLRAIAQGVDDKCPLCRGKLSNVAELLRVSQSTHNTEQAFMVLPDQIHSFQVNDHLRQIVADLMVGLDSAQSRRVATSTASSLRLSRTTTVPLSPSRSTAVPTFLSRDSNLTAHSGLPSVTLDLLRLPPQADWPSGEANFLGLPRPTWITAETEGPHAGPTLGPPGHAFVRVRTAVDTQGQTPPTAFINLAHRLTENSHDMPSLAIGRSPVPPRNLEEIDLS